MYFTRVQLILCSKLHTYIEQHQCRFIIPNEYGLYQHKGFYSIDLTKTTIYERLHWFKTSQNTKEDSPILINSFIVEQANYKLMVVLFVLMLLVIEVKSNFRDFKTTTIGTNILNRNMNELIFKHVIIIVEVSLSSLIFFPEWISSPLIT